MVHVHLLGPVELSVGGQMAEVGPPQRRTVMAALAVETGRPVGVATLIDRVWDADPPNAARRAVHAHIARIRQVCMQATDRGTRPLRLVRRSSGYVLDADPEQVDVHLFRQLVDRAQEPELPDDTKAALLREALGLWRGEPLSGLHGQWAARMRETWRRQQVDAAVGWSRIELRRGDPDAVIGPLTDLLAQYPLTESLAEMLMRALHGSGRSAEALDCFADVRRCLAEEVGTDPGPALRSLHEAILRGHPFPSADPDPDLELRTATSQPARPEPRAPAAPEPSPSPSPSPQPAPVPWPPAKREPVVTPAQLPLVVRGFIGRDEELAWLVSSLDQARGKSSAVVISAVSGMAGVGKTALAVHWARQVASEFPDGQLYVNLRGFDPRSSRVTPTQAVRGFLDAFGVRPERIPSGLEAQVGLYRSLLAGRRVLVVLDNAWDEQQVRPLLPGAPGCMALVTSRNRLTGLAVSEGAHLLYVDVLGPDAAGRILAERIGADRLAAEPDAVREIIAWCAGLPLALAVVAARAAAPPHRPLSTLARELREERNRLDALDAGEVVSQVRAVLSWSYRALSSGAARLFRLLGLHPGPDAGLPAIAALAGVPPQRTRELLSELTRGHLLAEQVPGRYTFHDLLRVYAGELVAECDDERVRREALHRMLDHYLHTARAADALVTPQPNPIELPAARPGANVGDFADYDRALAWFTAECTVLLEVVRQAPKGFEGHVWRLTAVVTTYLDRHGYWQALEDAGRRAMAAALLEDDRAGQAGAHRTLGLALDRLQHPASAREHYTQALELFAALGNDAGQARTCQHLARLSGSQGDRQQALEHARRSLRHYRAAGDRAGQSAALNHMGWQLAHLGDYQRALSHCQQALALALETEDFNGLAHTWDSLGHIHHQLGQHHEAVDCYHQAAELFHATGERNHEARCLTRLGVCYDSIHESARAQDTWTRALTVAAELGLPEQEELRTEIHRRLLRVRLRHHDGA
ncbi:BTAD domain-containing putative transcriptional regulator [Streptomyces sp. NPDC008092]|uniref:AfsR/SARP family transcriptional regulator n=1 Tax=Streptomyces sp. NPDC008092 TaxID=3364808 RepID=UPI0036E4D66B